MIQHLFFFVLLSTAASYQRIDTNALMNQMFKLTKDDFRYTDKLLIEHDLPTTDDGYFRWLATNEFVKKDNPCFQEKMQNFWKFRKEAKASGHEQAAKMIDDIWMMANDVRRKSMGPVEETKVVRDWWITIDQSARNYLIRKFPALRSLW
ncbi:hypothetical protein COOONC_11458 [Cooperia oncophora]